MSDERIAAHSGDIGDLISGLSLLKTEGGRWRLNLYPAACTGHRMTSGRVASLRPLFELQHYISGVDWSPKPEGWVMDEFRQRWRNGYNLADIHAAAFGKPHIPRERPWLVVPTVKRVARVVMGRSPRYQNWNMVATWKRAWEEYRLDAVFVGSPEEHSQFVQHIGPVAYYCTKDHLELAEVIAGADLCLFNQTGNMWVAEALKTPIVLEACMSQQNCHWERFGQTYGTNEFCKLPSFGQLRDRWASNMARKAEDRTLLTEDRLKVIAEEVRRTERLPGVMAECGCYRGGASKVIGSVAPHKKLFVFDTFSGLPSDDTTGGVHKAGEFASDRAEVEAFLAGLNVEIRQGIFPETTVGLERETFSFVHLDMDLYEPTAAALNYFWPMMAPGGVIVLDDVDWHHTPGVSKALVERGLMDRIEKPARQQGVLRKPDGPIVVHTPPPPSLDLTVIVISWKRPHLLRDTLASIKSKLTGLKAKIVVADNESTEETRAVIAEAGVECWPLAVNTGINWPIEHLLGPSLDSEFVMISDHDIHYGRDLKTYIDFLKANPDVSFAKGLDAPEHPEAGERIYGGERWITKKSERGGGVIMRTETLKNAFPLPDHVINFDWHLCGTGGLWGILPGTYAHTGWQDSTRPGVTGTPEKHILVDGVIVPNPNL